MSPIPEDDKNRDDPEKSESNVENLEVPQYTLNVGTSSDSDEEEEPPNGYQLLPQDPEGCRIPYAAPDDDEYDVDLSTPTNEEPQAGLGACSSDQTQTCEAPDDLDEDPSITNHNPAHTQMPPCRPGDSVERLELWNAPQESKLKMDKDQTENIKQAMSGFSVPPPPWAKLVSEQQWKTKLIAQLPGQPVRQTNPWQIQSDALQPEEGDHKTTDSGSALRQNTVKSHDWADFADFK